MGEICKIFHIDPLRLISSGSMIIVAPEGEKLSRELSKIGILATIIGKVVEGNTPIVFQNGEKSVLDQPVSDELYKAINYSE